MKVDLSQFANILRDTPAQFETGVIRGLQEAAIEGVGIVVAEIDESGITDSGRLRQSVRADLTARGAVLRVDAPHAPFVEYGTRPGHVPPIAPLILWAVRKLGLTEEEAKGVAFAVREKFRRDGMRPRRFFARAMRKIHRRAELNIRRELDALLPR